MTPEELCAQRYRLENDHAWFKARQRLIFWLIQTYFPRARNLLEIGIGTGVMVSHIKQHFPDMAVYGGDRIGHNFPFCRAQMPNVEFIQLDALQLPMQNTCDVIGAFDMIEHIEDDSAVLSQIHDALVPGGGMILTVPQHPFLWSRFDEYEGSGYSSHKRRYTRKELVRKVTDAKFSIVKVTSFVSLLLPALMASRLMPSKKPITQLTGLKVGPVTNAVLDAILRLEYMMIRAGADLPMGGSLILLARKNAQHV